MRRSFAALVAVALLALGIAACGGGSGSTSSTQSTAATTTARQGGGSEAAMQGHQKQGGGSSKAKQQKPSGESGESEAAAKANFKPKHHHDSGGGSSQFIVKGGDNSVQTFGSEGSSSEFEEASTVVHNFLDARAEKNWAAACSYLAKSTKQSFAQLAAGSKQLKDKGCAAILGALSGGVPESALKEAAQANIGALRAKGEQGFVIYRGAQHTTYTIPVVKEGGKWKVASLAGTPLS